MRSRRTSASRRRTGTPGTPGTARRGLRRSSFDPLLPELALHQHHPADHQRGDDRELEDLENDADQQDADDHGDDQAYHGHSSSPSPRRGEGRVRGYDVRENSPPPSPLTSILSPPGRGSLGPPLAKNITPPLPP